MNPLMHQYRRISDIKEQLSLKLQELADKQIAIYKEILGPEDDRFHWTSGSYTTIDECGTAIRWRRFNGRESDEQLSSFGIDKRILEGDEAGYREELLNLRAIRDNKEKQEKLIWDAKQKAAVKALYEQHFSKN